MDEQQNATQRQTDIMERLSGLMAKLEETRHQITLLRLELGVDNTHGRIPIAEATLVRHELRMDRMDEAIGQLQHGVSESVGKHKVGTSVIAILSGGGVAGLIELAKVLLK